MSSNPPQEAPPRAEHNPPQPPRWSDIEDRILKQAVARHGVSHWDDVARAVWTRKSAEECRARWAALVPVLYQGLARRESALEQCRRGRSVTVSAVASSASMPGQGDGDASSPTLPLPRAAEGSVKFHTEPSSPTPLATPTAESPSLLLSSASARNRRNTEPGERPLRTGSASRGRGEEGREWLAPHPLMRGRPRRTPTSSRDTSVFKGKDSTTKEDLGRG
ncbi:hypothetical protein F4814DRAFT_452369 [Daldinia grandis]|nr:hypothetical protein F4814DRAFT_452369 [Daldinia grandis]